MKSVYMRISALVEIIAQALAAAGGLALIVITVLTLVSVTGRSLIFIGLSPIPGDFELVEAGMAFAIFAFFPWCHLKGKHITVDILTRSWPPLVNQLIDLVANTLMLGAAILIAWRHWYGLLDKLAYGETSFILEYPIWWGYAGGMIGAAIFVVVALFRVAESILLLIRPDFQNVHTERGQ